MRCGCPKPCVRRHFDVKRWKDFAHTNAKDMQVNEKEIYFFAKNNVFLLKIIAYAVANSVSVPISISKKTIVSLLSRL